MHLFQGIRKSCSLGNKLSTITSLRYVKTKPTQKPLQTQTPPPTLKPLQTQKPSRILVTGCLGQIGSELVPALIERGYYVVGTDVRKRPSTLASDFPFCYLDVTDKTQMASVVVEHGIDWIIHNAAVLSGAGEMNPQMALRLNIEGTNIALEIARLHNLRILIPSSIAAFGPTTPKEHVPDFTIQRPTTVYGITKVYAELMGEYYSKKYSLDFRSLRYPGIISSKTLPGFGTTDYAVEIYYHAVSQHKIYRKMQPPPYLCFLKAQQMLPMMYMPDCLEATTQLLEADERCLKQRTYNVGAMSFTPAEITASIRKFVPEFKSEYKPDFRQGIAESWPTSLDDSAARRDWNWQNSFGLDEMSADMLMNIERKYRVEKLPDTTDLKNFDFRSN